VPAVPDRTDLDLGPDLVGWPAEDSKIYRERGYWLGQTIGQVLVEAAERLPAHLAVMDPDRRLTFGELIDAARRRAAGLVQLGLRPGDVVVPQLPNSVDFAITMTALWLAGAVPVAALPAHRDREIAAFLRQTRAVAHVVPAGDGRFDYPAMAARMPGDHLRIALGSPRTPGVIPMARVDAEPADLPEVAPSGLALLQCSSGSTGVPKLIPRTHDDYLYAGRASAAACGLTSEDVYLAALPAAHNFPLISPGVLGCLARGATVVFSPTPSPMDCFAAIRQARATLTSVVPPVALAWLAASRGMSDALESLRLIQIGGATCPRALAERVEPELGCRLQQMFGMAEGMIACTRPDDPLEIVLGTQGRPVSPADELRLVDSAGRPTAGEGELQVRGPYTIRAYYRADAPARAAFTADGFYRTGDLVRLAPGGEIQVTGRVKDQINRGGEKIAPGELEDCLIRHPGVHDAVVLGLPDAYLGERVCAVVIRAPSMPTGSVGAPELRAHVRAQGVADFKVLDRIDFVDAYPKVGVGKTYRQDLRAALCDRLLEGDR
jgi:2,3-dihydroxybenzoate-AMP ligase